MTYLFLDISEKELKESEVFDGINTCVNNSSQKSADEVREVFNTERNIEAIENFSVRKRIWHKLVVFAVSDGLAPTEKQFLIHTGLKIGLEDKEIEEILYAEPEEVVLMNDDEREIYLRLAIDLAKVDGIISAEEKRRIVAEAQKMGLKQQIITFLGKLIEAIQESDKRLKIIEQQSIAIAQQSEEIQAQNDALAEKNKILEEQKKAITDSIYYAKNIQSAFLPHTEKLKMLKEHFILYKPKDIVSGDFYWVKEQKDRILVTAADSTGHGVPGAFLSILGSDLLDKIMLEHGSEHFSPAIVLDKLRTHIKESLDQEKPETEKDAKTKDGMDMALIALDKDKKYLEYAGAYNPLYIIRNGELIHNVRATRSPVGIYIQEKKFENHRIDLEEGDMIYMFSDGYVDQFGGPDGKKLRSKKFQEILCSIADKPEEEQKVILDQVMRAWMSGGETGNEQEQVDDIIVMGIRV